MEPLKGAPPNGHSRIATIGSAIVLIVFLITIVGLSLLAMAEGGYRAERYAGTFDPFRAGILVFIVPGCAVAVLFAAAALESRRLDPPMASSAGVVSAVGFLVMAATLVALMLWWPSGATQVSLPLPMGVTLFAGLGLVVLGTLPDLASGLRDTSRHGGRFRRRDRLLYVGLAMLAAWFLIGILRRM